MLTTEDLKKIECGLWQLRMLVEREGSTPVEVARCVAGVVFGDLPATDMMKAAKKPFPPKFEADPKGQLSTAFAICNAMKAKGEFKPGAAQRPGVDARWAQFERLVDAAREG